MTTSHSVHHAKDLRVTMWMPNNDNCIRLEVATKDPRYVTIDGARHYADTEGRDEFIFFGLPRRVTDALMWALACHNETDRQRAEELAERIEQVLSDTNDIDVSFADFGLAVACDLLGIDADEIYAARREERAKAKEAAA